MNSHRLLSRNGHIDDLSIPDIEESETSDIDVDGMPEICDSDSEDEETRAEILE